MTSASFKNVIDQIFILSMYLIYMDKKDLALNILQWLICYETLLNKIIYM